MNRLHGKRALITGGTTGIGLETARQFLAEGARLIITGGNPENLKRARQELGDEVTAVQAEATDLAAQRRLADTVAETFGQLDVAFLNAGVSTWQPLQDWTEEAFDRQLTINFKSPFFLLQALLPHLADPASVILTGSNSAHGGFDRANAYAATKAALASLAPSLSRELLGRGVRVNAVSPGVIDTPLYGKLGIPTEYYDGAMNEIRSGIPAGRFGTAREIAAAVVYLASDESAFVVGSDFIIDGGGATL